MLTLSAGAVARQLGISPATLRTWAHRYGLEPSARSEGAHRRYTPEDVDRLVSLQRLTRSGVPVAQAAAIVRGAAPAPAVVPRQGSTAPEPGPGAVRALWEAAQALDGQRCARLVSEGVRSAGVLPAWQHLIMPALQRAGDQWRNTNGGVDVEHVLSDAITAGLFLDLPVKRGGVLLAATATEEHVLPLYALRAALAEQGIGAEMLTARTPAAALGEAARRLHPAVIILWAQLSDNADTAGFEQLPGLRPRPALALAGPGWHDHGDWPHLTGLPEALDFVREHF